MSDFTLTSALLGHFSEWVHLTLEATAIVVIACGAVSCFLFIARNLWQHQRVQFTGARLEMGRYLALALELQLAADLVESAISPSWQRLGQLAAIVAIRTALNYFLGREMREEREMLKQRVESSTPVTTQPNRS